MTNDDVPQSDLSPAERIVERELRRLLRERAVGESFHLDYENDGELLVALERFVPEVLAAAYDEWRFAGLDGMYDVVAIRVDPNSLELAGTALLLRDQCFTPIHARLGVGRGATAALHGEIRIGEPGGGSLGISGPRYSAYRRATPVHLQRANIDWTYRVSFE